MRTQIEDRIAIEQVIYGYSDALTRVDAAQFETLWMPDAVWEVAPPTNIRVEGYEQIRDAIFSAVDRFEPWIQVAHNPVITLLDDAHARSTTTMHEIGKWRDPAAGAASRYRGDVNLYGIYYDDLVFDGNRWRFATRRFVPLCTVTGVADVHATTPRHPLLEHR
jgi:ketosteroid isomerase-like protein